MCRLYGFRASEPTRVECSLVHAQNALMEQSRLDQEGLTHGHGWGVAEHPDGVPLVERQAWAAYHGEHFKKTAARIYSKTVIAHVRRATVGSPGIENTHPFVHGVWLFAHNGTVPNFGQVRHRLLEVLDPLHRTEINGSTEVGWVRFTYPINMTRHPAGTVCAGLTSSGTPIGLQIIGRHFREADVLAAMAIAEQVIGFTGRPPSG